MTYTVKYRVNALYRTWKGKPPEGPVEGNVQRINVEAQSEDEAKIKATIAAYDLNPDTENCIYDVEILDAEEVMAATH